MNNQLYFCFIQQQRVEYVVISYRDSQLKRKYVDFMPVHWIEDHTLWFPPAGKSEAASQLVNKTSWRQYRIRLLYWDTRTLSRTEASVKANELRRQEEREAEENGDTTSTDADVPQRQRPVAKQTEGFEARTKPPSAPSVASSVQRKLYPKPPPSPYMLEKKRKQPPSPTTSDEEERDPTWHSTDKEAQKKRKLEQISKGQSGDPKTDGDVGNTTASQSGDPKTDGDVGNTAAIQFGDSKTVGDISNSAVSQSGDTKTVGDIVITAASQSGDSKTVRDSSHTAANHFRDPKTVGDIGNTAASQSGDSTTTTNVIGPLSAAEA